MSASNGLSVHNATLAVVSSGRAGALCQLDLDGALQQEWNRAAVQLDGVEVDERGCTT